MSEQVGRPTKYKPEYDNMAYLHCRKAGAKDSDLGELFGVAEQTINNWKNDHPSFLESLKKGKDEFDTDSVENALLNRALGCKVKETRISGGGDDDQAPAAVETVKELPPDPTACIFWLKNRNPERWRDKVEHDHDLTEVAPIKVEILPTNASKP